MSNVPKLYYRRMAMLWPTMPLLSQPILWIRTRYMRLRRWHRYSSRVERYSRVRFQEYVRTVTITTDLRMVAGPIGDAGSPMMSRSELHTNFESRHRIWRPRASCCVRLDMGPMPYVRRGHQAEQHDTFSRVHRDSTVVLDYLRTLLSTPPQSEIRAARSVSTSSV